VLNPMVMLGHAGGWYDIGFLALSVANFLNSACVETYVNLVPEISSHRLIYICTHIIIIIDYGMCKYVNTHIMPNLICMCIYVNTRIWSF